MMPDTRKLAVLGYHKIGPPPPGGWESWFYIPEDVFNAQLDALSQLGWRVIGLDDLLRGFDAPETLPRRAALLTFDDGCRSFLDIALPCLETRGLPAVMFVPTDFIGGRNDFDHGCEPEEAICGWDDLRRLDARGVSIQSHAASHRQLSLLSEAELADEFHRSKRVLEAGLGRAVDALAYPFGDTGSDPGLTASLLSRAGYRAAFLYGGGIGPGPSPPGDPFMIGRIAVGPDTDLASILSGAEPGRDSTGSRKATVP
jgi:peptidoglycan/xylan/chitin deacetylase (PgdA/CDA1 family)